MLEDARKMINDLNSLSHFIIERKREGDSLTEEKASWVMDYRNVLIEELKRVVKEISRLQTTHR